MSLFTNKDIKRHFALLSYVFVVFIVSSQLYFYLSSGAANGTILLFSIALAIGIYAVSLLYFRKQQKLIENAKAKINLFLSGDSDARIDSNIEGGLYKLFHEVNTLATTLNAHAVREQQTKDFLRNTISDISHQLKTPLAALAIYNSLLAEECEDKAAVCQFTHKSEKEIERIEMLVQNLLKITKLDSGAIFMDKQIQNVFEMMNDIKSHFEMRASIENKDIILSGSHEVTLFCDRSWLIEAVSNILKNALDHMGENSQVHIEWKRLPSVTQIVIKDNGSGIHPEDIHHIFKRFYRSRFSKDTQGIGLGLPLSKAIVEANDGSISVESTTKNGSTFIISFLNLTKL